MIRTVCDKCRKSILTDNSGCEGELWCSECMAAERERLERGIVKRENNGD